MSNEISTQPVVQEENYDAIAEAQRVMKIKVFITIAAVLLLVLEASIETSDSMEARGYGLHGRTSFHLFKMSPTDYLMLAVILVTGGAAAIGCALGRTSIYYYPVIRFAEWDYLRIITLASFTALLAAPMLLDITGEKKWQRLRLEI